jgi:hypothetical protein
MWGEREGKPLTRARHNSHTLHDVGVLPEAPGNHLRRRRPRSVIETVEHWPPVRIRLHKGKQY